MRKAVSAIFISIVWLGHLAFAGWSPPVRISERGIFDGIDGGIYSGKVYFVLDMTQPSDWIWYQESTDFGQTWSNPMVLPDTYQTIASNRASIARYGNWLFTAWHNVDNQGPDQYNIAFRRSSNLGNTWNSPAKVLAHDLSEIGYWDIGALGNRPYVIIGQYINNIMTCQTCLANSFGQIWGGPRDIFTCDHISKLHTVATGNIIHLLWNGAWQDGHDYGIFYSRSTDNGLTWSANFDLRPPDSSFGEWSNISVNERGDLVACWMDYRFAPPLSFTGDIFYRISSDSGMPWQDEVQITDLHTSMAPDVAWQESTMAIAYMDYRDSWYSDEIYLRKSTDNGENWLPEERMTNDSLGSESPKILAQNGTLYLFWSSLDQVGWDTSEYSGIFFKRFDPEPDKINEDNNGLPSKIDLASYPNPFNDGTTISLSLAKGGETRLEIYDVTGKLIKRILKGGYLQKGTYKYAWDATDASGKKVSSGIYFARALNNNNSSLLSGL